MRLIPILLATCLATAASIRTADACSYAECNPGWFKPHDGTTVPSNTPALYWRTQWAFFEPFVADPQLVTLATTTAPLDPLAFVATPVASGKYLIVPDQPLVEGTSYVLHDGNMCPKANWPTRDATFQVAAAAPLPSQLGTVALVPLAADLVGVSSDESCVTEVQSARARVTFELAAEAIPWRDALHFETLVDGQLWWETQNFAYTIVESDTGTSLEVVFRICEPQSNVSGGVDGGVHELSRRATLPGSDLVITTPVVSFQLECPVEPPDEMIESGGGCSTSTRTSSAWLAFALALGLRRRRVTT